MFTSLGSGCETQKSCLKFKKQNKKQCLVCKERKKAFGYL